MMLHAIVQAIGLVFVVEGLIYAVAPGGMRRMMAELPKLSDEQIGLAGVSALAIGVAVVWLVRIFG
jgi:uncharacterized protein YjeT (DUF2065 family)